ncbi:hypothetical protein D3C83_246560 [compost metagenome]
MNCRENLQGPVILTGLGQCAALLIEILIGQNAGFNFYAFFDIANFLEDFAFFAGLHFFARTAAATAAGRERR